MVISHFLSIHTVISDFKKFHILSFMGPTDATDPVGVFGKKTFIILRDNNISTTLYNCSTGKTMIRSMII
jgi:hypothetical protein